ncbi:hypothetical protein FB451DRAFT_1432432 [Mycena latifolia]|nr:hypothetical protein FB451DRAFT_1432432 [Mycena latifolia]
MFFKILSFAPCTFGLAHAEPPSQIPFAMHTASLLRDAQSATVASLTYGFPLTQCVIFADSIANKSGGWMTNGLHHETTLANAKGLIDLSGGDVLATIHQPMEAGRFFVWPFYDIYGDNFCHFGTATNSTGSGRYLITYRESNPGCDLDPSDEEYAGIVYMPTIYGATLLRIEVDNSTDADHVVNCIHPGFTLEPYTPHARYTPTLTEELLNEDLEYTGLDSLPLYIMNLTARLAGATLEAAGISLSAHTYSTPSGVNLTRAFAASVAQVLSVEKEFVSLGNDWSAPPFDITGDFHSAYDMRAFVAYKGYMQLNVTEALYPSYEVTEIHYSNQTYLVEWYGKPQVQGFWSLTMYDEAGYLVPNDLNRYILNNRGNMTYPEGGLVRDSPADSTTPFYMLMQSTDYPISPEWESNWLPTPAGGKPFEFLLRLYGPEESVYDGTWTYPKITKVGINPPLPSDN